MEYTNSAPSLLLALVSEHFPGAIQIEGKLYARNIIGIDQGDQGNKNGSVLVLDSLLRIISSTIGNHYLQVNGADWQTDKLKEMQEYGLTYVYYADQDDRNNEIVAFVSFSHTTNHLDNDQQSLYLYEIHVLDKLQGHKIGKLLMTSFHSIAGSLGIKTELTVFTQNTRAKNWYFQLGYAITDESPQPKKLRNGKIIEPDYYILERGGKLD